MKKLLFVISIPLFSLLGLHAYAADNAATTYGLKSNQMRNMDSRNETMPATPATDDSTKPVTEEKKEANKEVKKATPPKTTPKTKKKHTSKKNKKK